MIHTRILLNIHITTILRVEIKRSISGAKNTANCTNGIHLLLCDLIQFKLPLVIHI